jgi:hypothetical protein
MVWIQTRIFIECEPSHPAHIDMLIANTGCQMTISGQWAGSSRQTKHHVLLGRNEISYAGRVNLPGLILIVDNDYFRHIPYLSMNQP